MNDCCRHPFVSQTRGLSTTSTDLLRCTMKKLQRLSISSYLRRQSSVAVVRQIHGLIRTVGRQSVKLGDWTELLDDLTQMTLLP